MNEEVFTKQEAEKKAELVRLCGTGFQARFLAEGIDIDNPEVNRALVLCTELIAGWFAVAKDQKLPLEEAENTIVMGMIAAFAQERFEKVVSEVLKEIDNET